MNNLRKIVGGATIVLAISGAFLSNAATGPRKTTAKPYSTTLYRPADCQAFDCGTSGNVSCNSYKINPPSAPDRTDCSTTSINSLVHQ